MNEPVFHGAIPVGDAVSSLSSTMPVPGFGSLAVNAFLVEAAEPMLVDAGLPALAEATVGAIAKRIEPRDIRWIWLTHCDADHLGALEWLLDLAPQARIVTNYLGMGKLSMRYPLPPERFHLVNPGQSLSLGDRRVRAVAMPSYDAPETMGLFDPASGALFSSDCFGALLGEANALGAVEDAGVIGAGDLAEGIMAWTNVDAPWLRHVAPAAFERAAAEIRRLQPKLVLGSHLPPARAMTESLLAALGAARDVEPFVGPDQAALEAMMSSAA
jgi:glyoxylase-like metal-dependent hydrolase (beta-lactamase superfamily II)